MDKKLIALAVSGALAIPIVASAQDSGSGPTLYGRLNVGIDVKKTDPNDNSAGSDTVVSVRDVVSRFGIKGEEDLGNGLAAIYRYEFRVNASEGSLVTGTNQRLSYVGLKGGFGQVSLGAQWGAFYNFVGTYIDPTYTLGYYGYSGFAGGDYRIPSSLQYSGAFGPLALQVDLSMEADNTATDDIDRYQVGASYDAGPVLLSAAYDRNKVSETDDGQNVLTTDILGINANYSNDTWGANLGWMDNDQVGDLWSISGNYWATETDNLFLQYWKGNADTPTEDQDGVTFGYYHYVSDRTKLWTEIAYVNPDADDASKITQGLFGLRHDF